VADAARNLSGTVISPLASSLLKTVIPLAVIAALPFVAGRRNLSMRDDIGLKPPPLLGSAMWIALYMIWMFTTDILMDWRGPWDFTPWRDQTLLVTILRILGAVILGPIAEELVFRGYAQALLKRTRLETYGSIIVVALLWAALHYRFGDAAVVLIVCGLFLGMARETTGSVITPAMMHILWNLYALW
jgi:membrane protease YdiL (CAAX protease family)